MPGAGRSRRPRLPTSRSAPWRRAPPRKPAAACPAGGAAVAPDRPGSSTVAENRGPSRRDVLVIVIPRSGVRRSRGSGGRLVRGSGARTRGMARWPGRRPCRHRGPARHARSSRPRRPGSPRSCRWASASCSAVTPKKPECTSMNFAIATLLGGSALSDRWRHETRAARDRVIGRTTDDHPEGAEIADVGRRSETRDAIGRMTDDRDDRVLHSPAMDRPLRAVRCPLLIGRDDLLELTDRRLDDVLAGHGQFLLARRPGGDRQDASPRRDPPQGGSPRVRSRRRRGRAAGSRRPGLVHPRPGSLDAADTRFALLARRCSSSTRPSSPRSTPSGAGSSWRPWS